MTLDLSKRVDVTDIISAIKSLTSEISGKLQGRTIAGHVGSDFIAKVNSFLLHYKHWIENSQNPVLGRKLTKLACCLSQPNLEGAANLVSYLQDVSKAKILPAEVVCHILRFLPRDSKELLPAYRACTKVSRLWNDFTLLCKVEFANFWKLPLSHIGFFSLHETLAFINRCNSGFTFLDLRSYSDVTDKQLRTIIRNNPSLQDLYIKDSAITGTGFERAFQLQHLKRLYLIYCYRINEIGISYLAKCATLQLTLIFENYMESKIEQVRQLPNLVALDVGNCECITKCGVEVISGLTNLKKLILKDASLSSSWQHFNQAELKNIAKLTNLEYLNLIGTDFNNTLIELLSPLTNLTFLALNGWHLTHEGFETISKNFTKLIELHINICHFEDPGTVNPLLALANLTRLSLRNWNGLYTQIDDLTALTNLETLDISQEELYHPFSVTDLKSLTSLQNLEKLNISGTFITDDELQSLASFPKLTELKMNYLDRITDQGLTSLGKISTLQVLSLQKRHNRDRPTAEGVLNLIGRNTETANLPVLTKINLKGFHLTNEAVQSLSRLKSLEHVSAFLSSKIEEEENSELFSLSTLTSLHLLNSPPGGKTFSTLAQLQNIKSFHFSPHNPDLFNSNHLVALLSIQNLTSLDLMACSQIEEHWLEKIAAHQKITELNLSCCISLKDAGIAALSSTPRLKTLMLDSTKITDRAILYLRSAKRITSLDLEGCVDLTDKAIKHLASMPHLLRVTLTHCPKMSKIAMQSLVKKGIAVTAWDKYF